MQIGSLVPLLALLAAPAFARSSVHPNAAAHRRQDVAHERVNSAVERREALAETQPRALAEKPKFKKITRRGARGCRAKNSTATASDSATASAPSGNSTVVASNSTDTNVTSTVTTQSPVGNTSSSSESAAATASSIENLAALQQPSSSSSVSLSFDWSSWEVSSQDHTQTGDSSTAASSTSVASAAATASSSSNSTGSYTPNGIKAGISGDDPLSFLQGHIGWYYGKSFLVGIHGHTNNLKTGTRLPVALLAVLALPTCSGVLVPSTPPMPLDLQLSRPSQALPSTSSVSRSLTVLLPVVLTLLSLMVGLFCY